jgi:flagella basal body P-ring formation protein FlgA
MATGGRGKWTLGRKFLNIWGAGKSTSKLPVLAKPGRFATLVMLGQNIRITTTVLPLQPGSKGQRILVRDPDTQRVMSAEVVDEGLLQAGF